jgi:hypothetical protein
MPTIDPVGHPARPGGKDIPPDNLRTPAGCPICYWEGQEYSDGAFVCVNDPNWPQQVRYVCRSGTWRQEGFC